MKSLVHKLMLVGLAVAIALPMAAAQQEKDKKEKKKDGGGTGPIAQIREQLASIELTADQRKKVDAIVAEYEPKVAPALKKAGDGLRQMAEARKKFKDEGKKGKELTEAVKGAVKLTPDQQTAVDELEKLGQDIRMAVSGVLTDEQKEKAGFNKGKKKKAA